MSLKEIFCQDRAVTLLQKALAAAKMPHAYIFAGPEGIGKFKTAREWAKLLLCKNRLLENEFADSCGSCDSCRLFEAGSHPDFHLIYKELREFTTDGKGKPPPVELPIDVIREFLINKVSTRPALSARKVFLVSEAEKLNAPSQNALLKVLEEPPPYCCIILLCTRMEDLLPTTKSRCRTIRFGPVAEDRIIKKLAEMGLHPPKARFFARLAWGSLGMASQWARLELAGANVYQTKKDLLTSLAACQLAQTLDLAQWLAEESKKIAAAWTELDKTISKTDIKRRAEKTLVQIVISALHDAMILGLGLPESIINFDQREQIEKLTARLDFERAAAKIADAYGTVRWIESSVNQRLVFEQLLLNLAGSATMDVWE